MKKVLNIAVKVSFVFYFLVLCIILFLGQRGHFSNLSIWEYALMRMNIIPFKTITEYISAIFTGSMNLDIPIKNLLGNLILFLPMGIYLPLFFKKSRKFLSFFIMMIIILLAVEIIQLFTGRGSFDIDDLILNLSGAFIGFALWRTKFFQKIFSK